MACHICGCKRSRLQAVTGSILNCQQMLCSLCIQSRQPCLFFAATPAAAFNCKTSAMTTGSLTVPDIVLLKEHVQTKW